MADDFQINVGTAQTISADEIGTVKYPRVKLSVGADGVAADWQGTINTVAALTNGTVRVSVGTVVAGTLTNLISGTINSGTVESLNIGRRHADEFATVVSSGTNVLGTIRAAVAGSVIYVTGIVISVGSASNVVIGNGGTSLPVLGTLFFNANGGIAYTPIDPPLRTSSGSALVYQQSAAISSMTIQAVGYID